jgi:hypothetical protein
MGGGNRESICISGTAPKCLIGKLPVHKPAWLQRSVYTLFPGNGTPLAHGFPIQGIQSHRHILGTWVHLRLI